MAELCIQGAAPFKIEYGSSSRAMRLFSFTVVSPSYDLCKYETVHEKVKFVSTSMVSYEMRLNKNVQCLVFLKPTFVNTRSRCSKVE